MTVPQYGLGLSPHPGESVKPKGVSFRGSAATVGISWEMVRFFAAYQEIATPLRARNDRGNFQLVLLTRLG